MRIYRTWCKFCIRLVLVLTFTIIFSKLFMKCFFVKKQPVMVFQSQEDVKKELELILKDLVALEQRMGCQIPNLDPFSPEVTRFDKDVEPVSCDGDDWVECNFSKCYVKKLTLNRMKNLVCTYKDIVYVNDDDYYLGKAISVKGDGEYSLNMSDYVKISCRGIEVNSWRSSRWEGRKAGYRPLAPAAVAHVTSLNVFMIIIDSTSRNTFIRRMPTSFQVLAEELQAIVLNGYNIVGESTAGAMWPILTGHNELEVSDSLKLPTNTKRVDPEPFIFTLLNKYGYSTVFFEDMPWFHTFNFRFNGFEQMPANHYMRPLFQDISHNQNNWTDKDRYCFGSESLFKFMVEYPAKLFKVNIKKFCVILSGTFSHDDINSITMLDEELAHFLKRFKRERHLEDTVMFVMGDHGSKISAIRNTYQGRIEEFLPFVSIILPERLKLARPRALYNLEANSKVLTTPFDIHTTVLDALGLDKHRNKYKVPGSNLERGMSFLEPIPKSRSCGEAGIAPHFCACARWLSVSANDIVYTKVARELARFINEITAKNRHKCAKRQLLTIAGVYRLSPMIDLLEFTTQPSSSDRYVHSRGDPNLQVLRASREFYQAKIIMSPGEAIFEGSFQYNVKNDSYSFNNRDVSRVDRYGNESWCVSRTHPYLIKYCYCMQGTVGK